MSRRCKPGMRARFVGGGANQGRVVLVVRPHFGGEFEGNNWPKVIFGWVVTSLGAPLSTVDVNTGCDMPPRMSAVADDRDLEPLDDDDEGLDTDTLVERPKPIKRSTVEST